MTIDFPFLAGTLSSLLFAVGTLPMLFRAISTKDLHSYSRTSLLLANLGNGLHAIYIYSLPPGPIWLLHTFHLITTALMLIWHLRYATPPSLRQPGMDKLDDCSC